MEFYSPCCPILCTAHFICIPFLFFFLGLTFGSFGNVLLYRLPKNRTILGRSACPHCRKKLRAWELIPVVSYLLLRGRCARCQEILSARYPLIELASGLLFFATFLHEGSFAFSTMFLVLALWLLLLIAVTDLETGFIPDALNVPFVILAALSTFLHSGFVLSGIFLALFFFGGQWLFSRGRWIGSGDVILGAGIGALLGSWTTVLIFLFLAYVSGALVASVLLLLHRKTTADSLVFGPFMVMGGMGAFFFGGLL
ncbi:prepilin peptidase [Candidatus Peregrinibacteria bacterium]|nr:prepilin peptidase [Candidatus Peregrinibacteria bacterium]MBI3816146.1 prepilin peptidase [Candidatus Peregrinibacteria bacterium]